MQSYFRLIFQKKVEPLRKRYVPVIHWRRLRGPNDGRRKRGGDGVGDLGVDDLLDNSKVGRHAPRNGYASAVQRVQTALHPPKSIRSPF